MPQPIPTNNLTPADPTPELGGGALCRTSLVWLISTTLMFLWSVRISKKNCRMFEVRADLEARINFLRRGKRFQNEAVILTTMIENFF